MYENLMNVPECKTHVGKVQSHCFLLLVDRWLLGLSRIVERIWTHEGHLHRKCKCDTQGATMQLDKYYNFMEWKKNIALSKDVSPARKITRKRRTGKKNERKTKQTQIANSS